MDIPTPAYYPYENRSITRQVNRQQIKNIYSFINVKIMKLFLSLQPAKHLEIEPDKNTVIPFQEDLHNITEGAEFLDDAIRMKEQPFILMRAEESIAPGSPADLL
jgi:hypothetical protein